VISGFTASVAAVMVKLTRSDTNKLPVGGAVELTGGAAVWVLLKTVEKVANVMNVVSERIQKSSCSKYNIDYSDDEYMTPTSAHRELLIEISPLNNV